MVSDMAEPFPAFRARGRAQFRAMEATNTKKQAVE
jgi:hypothetical protein